MPRSAERLRIVVLGYVVRGPMSGMVLSDLQYVLGLRQLGHDVFFVEDAHDYPMCFDPRDRSVSFDPTYGMEVATRLFRSVGFDRWAYYDAPNGRWLGPGGDAAVAACAAADLTIDLAGVNPIRPWIGRRGRLVLVDKDPVFTQLRHVEEASGSLPHHAFFTFAGNIGKATCTVPDDGLPWRPTRHPVFLDMWPVTPPPRRPRFTTVMQWESYPAREHGGRTYGTKSTSMERYLDLPSRLGVPVEAALSGDAPRSRLREGGWRLVDPEDAIPTAAAYQRFLQRSSGELAVAKHGYVVTNSGWFSERSACYLASGRPVVVQDTGFGTWLPEGKGVVAFQSPDEACAGVEAVLADHDGHAAAAREAAASFSADVVLDALIEAAFATGPASTGGR